MIRNHWAMPVFVQLLCVCMLFLVTLYPEVSCKHGGYWGHGKGKHAPMQKTGSSRTGLKMAGAAAAGALGGAAVGYGLGSLARPPYGYSWDPSDRGHHDRAQYYNSSGQYYNGRWYRNEGGPGPVLSTLVTLSPALSIALWG